jgi:hypothetical protein
MVAASMKGLHKNIYVNPLQHLFFRYLPTNFGEQKEPSLKTEKILENEKNRPQN